ncbi:MAG: helix-turn-helix domain-containing protein [Candidatus Onthovivens sp.]|nr:helix-turn-helix domain-containing protein [Candidatus Onthovivens sp.]
MREDLARRLVDFRKRFDFSQEELANKLGVSRQTIIKWESGETVPSIDFVKDLSKIYGVTVDDLLNTDKPIEECYTKQSENKDNSRKGNFHIGADGIHIKDGEDEVHISGLGIHVKNDEEEVEISPKAHIKVTNKKGLDFNSISAISGLINSSCLLLAAIAYVVLGFTLKDVNGWGTWWTLFIFCFVPASLYEAIAKKNIKIFNIAFLAVSSYLTIGMYSHYLGSFDGWHPYWAILLSIPVFYIICDIIKGFKKVFDKRKLNEEVICDVEVK